MKGVFIVIDGVADEPLVSLHDRTPLEYASTPHLDALAHVSLLGRCQVLKKGVVPESSSAILSLLGYDPLSVERGPLEALGAGIRCTRGDLVLRTNFATIDDLTNLRLLDRRAGRTLSTRDARVLARAVNDQVKLSHPFTFYPTIQHRGVVVFRGGFSDTISDVDPQYGVHADEARVTLSHSLDDEGESQVAADLLNQFVRKSHEVLDAHPLNKTRAKKGFFSANFLLCRDAGREIPRLPKRKGSWMGLSYMPLEVGICRAAKMDVHSFTYPPLHGIDVYENLYSGLHLAIKEATRALSRHASQYDYFFIHFKETDIPGHDNKPQDKIRMIELIDKLFFSFLVPFVQKRQARVVLSPDHVTSCRLKVHTDAPVPFLFFDPTRPHQSDARFTEAACEKGKLLTGSSFLDETLFS